MYFLEVGPKLFKNTKFANYVTLICRKRQFILSDMHIITLQSIVF